MRLQTIVIVVILIAIALFAAVNWKTFTDPTDLWLVFTSVRLPLGLLLLGLLAGLTALFLAFALNLQSRAFRDARLHARQLRAARELAEQAEISRYTKLHKYLEGELARQAHLIEENRSSALTRIEQIEGELKAQIEQSANTLAAYFGEYEDLLQKNAPPPENSDRKNNS